MKNILKQDDINAIEERLKTFEKNTGCDLLLVVANSSDPYPAAAWRFGFISSFVISFIFSLYFNFEHGYYWPLGFFLLLALMTWIGNFDWAKRFALSDWEVDRETFEKALECFHTMGTSKVTHKVTAMIMISVLERKINILIDEKLKEKISQQELDDLVIGMQGHFREGKSALGFVHSIESFEAKILKDFSGRVSNIDPSQLSDSVHFIN